MKLRYLICGIFLLLSLHCTYATTSIHDEIAILQERANQGNAESQFDLGLIYYNGDVVKQDYSQALLWIKKSVEQEFSKAQFLLGLIYGEGVSLGNGDFCRLGALFNQPRQVTD